MTEFGIPARPLNVFDVMTDLIVGLDPHVKAVKIGTEHEDHDGWGMRGDETGVYRCSCGGDITDLIKAPSPSEETP